MSNQVIRTSVNGWLKRVAEAYRARESFLLEDDAQIGIDPREDTLLRMGMKAKLAKREWAGVLISVGIAGIGAWLIIMAVLDPEPYTKVATAIATGAVLLSTGGLVAVRILTQVKPPNIRVSRGGVFEIYWE
jgi:hypothetical protein